MLTAIRFDHEARIETNEVRDVRPERNLTSDLHARKLPVAKDAPQRMLGIGHVVAQVARLAQACGAREFPLTRRPAMPDATLSREGRGFNLACHRAIFQVVSISPVMGFFASIRAMPIATSSSLIRSASAQFFAFRAASRAFFSASTFARSNVLPAPYDPEVPISCSELLWTSFPI